MTGIYLLLPFKDVYIEKYYNKFKCSFNIYQHKQLVEKIREIENTLLKKFYTIHNNEDSCESNSNSKSNRYDAFDKEPQYKIQDQLKNGTIKIFSDDYPSIKSNMFILKISGIWETDTQYGLTYKFSKVIS